MADGYDRFDNEGGGGGSFVIGLLTGTVLGAGLGMLFAPKAGSELRNQLSEQAGNLQERSVGAGYRRASETAGEWADRGREMYDKARDAVSRGADEAQRYVREATSCDAGNAVRRPAALDRAARAFGSATRASAADPTSIERLGHRAGASGAMTSTTARTVANVVLVSAGVAAAYVVLTTPPLRRRVARAPSCWPGSARACRLYLLAETGRAWVESGRHA